MADLSRPPAKCLSLDHTFRAAAKATITDSLGHDTKLMKGGIVSTVNEGTEILAWVSILNAFPYEVLTLPQRFCQSQANAEIGEMLSGIRRRFEELGIPFAEMMVVDNCCHVRNEILKWFPDIVVVLDVYHFLMR
jgi:hypothetical protein